MQPESLAEKITKTSVKVFLDFKSIVMRYWALLLRNYVTVAELYITVNLYFMTYYF